MIPLVLPQIYRYNRIHRMSCPCPPYLPYKVLLQNNLDGLLLVGA